MKLRKILCILSASLLLLLTGCTQELQEDVTWYTKEQVRTFFGTQTTRSVYEYNEDWSTGSITTYVDGALESTVTYEHTETGYITRGIQDGVEDVMEVVITRDDAGNAVHTEQYLNGQLSSSADSTFDEKGNMLTYHTHVVEPDLYLKQETEYDSNGNKIKLTVDNGYMVTVTEYTYNSQGRLVKESSPNSNSRTEYTYSDGGKLETALIYGENGELTNKRISTYDDYGNMLLQETYDAEGNVMLTTALSYISTDGRTSSGIAG